MDTLLAIISGGVIGAVLGFVGAGGAMLSVPILLYIFDFSAIPATTGALAIVLCAALAGALPKARAKEILYRDAFVIWSLGLITNIAASILAHKLSDAVITTGFAAVLLIAAASMLRKAKEQEHRRMSVPVLILVSLGIGTLTGLFGIGGGFIVIPVLINAFGTPPRIASGTSLVVIALNSITAFIGHYSHWQEVAWKYPLIIGASAVVIALFTSHKQTAIKPDLMRRYFAALLICISAFTLFQSWS